MASDAVNRLKALTGKKRSGTSPASSTVWPELVKSPEADDKLKIVRYFDRVRTTMDRLIRSSQPDYAIIEESLNFYRIAIENAHQHTTAVGNLHLLAQETPGLQTFYGGVHVDASQIRKYLEEMIGVMRARKVKWLMNDPEARKQNGELKITEAKQWAEADENIADCSMLIRRYANAENQLGNIMAGFTTRSVMVSKITTIREAGLEEVWVDPTRETNNV